jgi:hypothetical protein
MNPCEKGCRTITRYTLLHGNLFPTSCLKTPCLMPLSPLFSGDLARWQQLITPLWLHDLMESRVVMAAPAANWRLFEVGCDALDSFLQGHLPGAAYLDTNCLIPTCCACCWTSVLATTPRWCCMAAAPRLPRVPPI